MDPIRGSGKTNEWIRSDPDLSTLSTTVATIWNRFLRPNNCCLSHYSLLLCWNFIFGFSACHIGLTVIWCRDVAYRKYCHKPCSSANRIEWDDFLCWSDRGSSGRLLACPRETPNSKISEKLNIKNHIFLKLKLIALPSIKWGLTWIAFHLSGQLCFISKHLNMQLTLQYKIRKF